jgi:cell division protein FtsQ
MSPVSAPSDRRFRRAHVKPSRKRRAWRALMVPVARCAVVTAIVLYGGWRLTSVAAHAHVLQVDRIIVRGNDRLSKGEVLAALNGLRGQSLVWTDLDTWRRRLLASSWVRDAALRRSLPSTVEVVISERQPIGIGRLRGDLYLVDDRGIVIDQFGPQYADLDLPIIDGLAATPGGDAGMTDEARADLAARVIAALRTKPDIARRLSQVDVADLHNAAVILDGDPAVIHLGEDQFVPRLQSYLELSGALRDRVPNIDYVDLRFDDRIYVRPAFAPSALRRGRPDSPAALRRGGPESSLALRRGKPDSAASKAKH